MKVGIKFKDNDFWNETKMFVTLFIVPTFIEREPGHMITHLTSSQIVNMYNLYIGHIYKYQRENETSDFRRRNVLDIEVKHIAKHLELKEQDIYWDNKIDFFLDSDMYDGDFCWTDGKKVYQ